MPDFKKIPAEIMAWPYWLQIALVSALAFALVACGPFGGWLIERRRRKAGAEWATTSISAKDEAEAQHFLKAWNGPTRPFGAMDVTFAGVPGRSWIDPQPTRLLGLVTAAPVVAEVFAGKPVPASDEPTQDQPIIVPSEPAPVAPSVPDPTEDVPVIPAEDMMFATQEINLADVWEAEVIEVEDEATRLFRADPLASWVLPPLEEFEYLPEADNAFRDLVARNWLTGEGSNVETKWEPWYADSFELEGANA